MSSHRPSTRRFLHIGVAAFVSVASFSGVAFAQEAPGPIEGSALARIAEPAPVASASAGAGERAAFYGLYAGYAVLQALDARMTVTAVRAGGRELNPLMSGLAGNDAGLLAVKAASGVGTFYLIEKLRRKNRVAAVVTMVALNSAYAAIVIHNTRVASGLNAR